MSVSTTNRVPLWWLAAAWTVCCVFCLRIEADRLRAAIESPGGALAWFTAWNAVTTLPGLILAALPGVLWVSQRGRRDRLRSRILPAAEAPVRRSSTTAGVTAGLCVAAAAVAASGAIGGRAIEFSGPDRLQSVRFASLPPAYHDEYSYRLQAETFRAGRWHWPPAPVRPELFHQFHVLNDPVTASRYFPWTGLWVAAFLGLEPLIIGHWVAGAIAAACFTMFLRNHLPAGWAFAAGLVIAVSPGIAVFSNLLLAHHPVLMALAVFLWSFDRFLSGRCAGWLIVSGTALALAMLGRPMTAAGFALPYGVWLLRNSELIRHDRVSQPPSAAASFLRRRHPRPVPAAWLLLPGLPLLAGFGVLAVQNASITGSAFVTPYQLYTEQYTPWHRYGFRNLRPDAEELPDLPASLASYNAWASELTPSRALHNVACRALASLQWSLGLIPLLFGLMMSVTRLFGRNRLRVVRLLWLSVLSLHMVHVPYWYDGILHWHYVFETAPLLIALAAFGWHQASGVLAALVRRRIGNTWLVVLVLGGLAPGWLDVDWAWGPARVSQAVSEQSYARVRHAQFRALAARAAADGPVLVLVDERGADFQLSYIINPPDLKGPVLVCRLPEDAAAFDDLRRTFPERTFLVFDPQTFTLTPGTGDEDPRNGLRR